MKRREKRDKNQKQRIKRADQKMKAQNLLLKKYVREKVIEIQGMEYQDYESFIKNYEIMMARGRSFLCSIDILEDPYLSSDAKILFQIISAFCINEGYCYASSLYLSQRMGKTEQRIKAYLKELDDYGLIKRDTYNTTEGWRRNIYIQFQFLKDRYFRDVTP